jgi:hypothetical protein
LDFIEEPLMMGAAMLHEYKDEAIHSQFLMFIRKYKCKNSSFQTPNAFIWNGW